MERLGSSYILEERIGAGAQGDVWKGRKEGSEEPLAFKKLRPELARERNVIDAFLKERDTLERVDSPHVVRLRDMVAEGETLGLVMDYVGGGDLADVIREQGALAPELVASYGTAIASGLSAIHAAGLVHRDVKPANILMDDSSAPPAPRVADFGVARICDSAVSTRSTGGGAGTPLYMAPEVADGLPAAPSMDIYSLGVVLYEMCCGVPPFTGAPVALLKSHMVMNPGRPDGVPDVLWDLIGRMMSKDPAVRPTADQVGRALTDAAPSLADLPAAPRLSSPPAPVPASAVAQTVLGVPLFSAPSAPSAVSASTGPVPVAPSPGAVMTPGTGIVTTPAPGIVVASASSSGAAMRPLPPVPRPSGRTINRGAPVSRPAGGAKAGGKKKGSRRDQILLITTVCLLAIALVIAGAIVAQYWFKNHSDSEAGSNGSGNHSSTPGVTTMPNLVGLTTEQAKDKLPGVQVNVVKAAAPNEEAAGTVLSTDPAAGEKISDTVTLTVVGSTKTVYLTELDSTSSSFSDEAVDMNGKTYDHGMRVSFSYYNSSQMSEWNLGRYFNTLSGTIGITDDSTQSDATFTVDFYIDQELIQSETLRTGEFKDISLDVKGGGRLKIVITRTDKKNGGANFGFGDFQLQGDSDKVPDSDDINQGG